MTIHILATGTSRGIGAAITAAFAHDDVRIIGHSTWGNGDLLAADLSDSDSTKGLWRDAVNALDGRVDILVNNAGIFQSAPIDQSDDEWLTAWEWTMRINLT